VESLRRLHYDRVQPDPAIMTRVRQRERTALGLSRRGKIPTTSSSRNRRNRSRHSLRNLCTLGGSLCSPCTHRSLRTGTHGQAAPETFRRLPYQIRRRCPD
jgi:hypothetical protein